MDEVRKSLSKQEQVLLADFWEDKDKLRALQKALLQRQQNLANESMAAAPNWETIQLNRGEILGSKWLIQFLRHNHKEIEKTRPPASQ